MSERIFLAAVILLFAGTANAEPISGFAADLAANEQTRTVFIDPGVRAVLSAPHDFNPARPTLLLLFALPNGNTIEQSAGCKAAPSLDWHFDIQHIAAQTRRIRSLDPTRNVIVAYLEADTLSWPAWRQKRPDAPQRIATIISDLAKMLPGKPLALALTCHSGGGAFIFSFLDSAEKLPANVERIVFLDANYSYDDEKQHGKKLLDWLQADKTRHLVVIAYDDRNITIGGKKVVSETGGTWRASSRMLERFARDVPLTKSQDKEIVRQTGMAGQAQFILHTNSEARILHTRLVELNGLIEAMTLGTAAEHQWAGDFFGLRAYEKFEQELPGVSARPPSSMPAKALIERLTKLEPEKREAQIATEITKGNFPPFLRQMKKIHVQIEIDGKPRQCVFDVMPDMLSIGSDDDFLRVPMTPTTAMKIAAALGCTLPTRTMVDWIDKLAEFHLEPRPLTEARESFATFAQHNGIIESQRAGKTLGGLVTGIKKDVVITNRLLEKPDKVAIYGWRLMDGKPIQPLTTVHKAAYVDYSHGIRLVRRIVLVDGKEMLIEDVLKDPKLCALLSDERPIVEAGAFYR